MGSQGGAGKLGVLTHQPLNLGQRPTPKHLVGSSWSVGSLRCPQTAGRQAVGSWGPQTQRGPFRIPAHWSWGDPSMGGTPISAARKFSRPLILSSKYRRCLQKNHGTIPAAGQ